MIKLTWYLSEIDRFSFRKLWFYRSIAFISTEIFWFSNVEITRLQKRCSWSNSRTNLLIFVCLWSYMISFVLNLYFLFKIYRLISESYFVKSMFLSITMLIKIIEFTWSSCSFVICEYTQLDLVLSLDSISFWSLHQCFLTEIVLWFLVYLLNL